MKEPINLLPLRSYLKTTYEMKELNNLLGKLQTAFFQKKQTFPETLEHEIPFPLSDILKKLATEHEVRLENSVDAQKFFAKLQESIEKIPPLQITLSFSPTLDLINQMNRWIAVEVNQLVVLDLLLDKSLIGGAKIGFKGKYLDYTLKKQLANTMKVTDGKKERVAGEGGPPASARNEVRTSDGGRARQDPFNKVARPLP